MIPPVRQNPLEVPIGSQPVDDVVRELVVRGDLLRAAELSIRTYGPEVYGLLCALHTETDAGDVFAAWTVQVWRGLAGFRWECALRTWVYTVARSASAEARRSQARRSRHEELLSDESGALARVAEEARSSTPRYLKPDVQRALDAFREALPEEERLLLILRLDRRLDWKDVARVLSEDATLSAPEADVTREAQRLRKRFQLLKLKLKSALREAGLLPAEEEPDRD